MKLYQITNTGLTKVHPESFKLEKDIQDLIEKNVNVLYNLELVKSEIKVKNFRFDTLCFDNETRSFVIIEYKKGTNYSVIDQGYSYLSTLLNNKSDFILEYNESLGKSLNRTEVDWTQTKIIFISPRFTEYQKNSINFKNLPFELWEIKRFSNNTIGLNQITSDSDVKIDSSISTKDSSNVLHKVSKEIIRYDEDHHLYKSKTRPSWVIELYKELKERIMNINENIECKYGKQTIGFLNEKIFTDLIIYNKGIGVVLNVKQGELNDYMNLTEDISNVGHWGNGEYRIWINKENLDLDYVLNLVQQSYNKNCEKN